MVDVETTKDELVEEALQGAYGQNLLSEGSQIITNRINPCRCGCSGTDPWHRKTFRRRVKQIRRVKGTAVKRCDWGTGARIEIVAVGRAKLPGSIFEEIGLHVWYVPTLKTAVPMGWYRITDLEIKEG